jgi:uncharacterized Rossmann fold enzyme
MSVKVKIYQPETMNGPEKLKAAKAAAQRAANEHDCIVDIIGRDADGQPTYKLTAYPTKKKPALS